MDAETRASIRKIQATLIQIQNTGRAPINITQYKKMGLITVTHWHYTDARGNDQVGGVKLHLTDKAKKMISVIV